MTAAAATPAAPAKRTHYLHTGQLVVSVEPTVVTTIVGSCVSVCIWDARLAIGGINHFLLPHRLGHDQVPARFGTLATNDLIECMIASGSRLRDLQAKVFGGASMMGGASPSIGDKNAAVALEVLAEKQVAVTASSVGGNRGRKIVFHTDSGETFVKVV